ncbi:4-hydroxybutyrate coenzyme A transferase [Mucinivorans hirudinis]|uniref:4-hydroxybutyrate coenzyme A transferase n=1 Tax=Mucinivorans hirudinis TaxID=1433126 RepID=A0A060RDT6_9BACT|nr:4-hydroxybutyrate coenzyme A transferase [Mucinivorans hirudinis]
MRVEPRIVSPAEAVKVVKSGDHIHFSSVASAPACLIKALMARGDAGELKDVHIHHLHTEGAAPYGEARYEGIFQADQFFVGGNLRKHTQGGFADYIPVFLSETQKLYRCGALPINVAMIQVSPPDKHGFVSLGTSVDATLAAVECADHVIAVINKYVPRSFGDAMIPTSMIDIWCVDDEPLEEAHFSTPTDVEVLIGNNCAALIEDGACLQMGIGAIPNAVLAQLGNHKNLGIHTEMFADGVLPLVESGVINGMNKGIDRGKMVSTFLMGSQKVYDFIDDNPMVRMMDVGYTNDPFIIAKNEKVTAINSALQVDITGQVCADSLGTTHYSGVGGQVDFIYGASLSKGGKAIIAMPAVTNKGVSKIAPTLNLGAGVVTTRAHMHYFVTEFGAVDLYGKTLQERARLVISVAAPEHREALDKAAFERFGSHHHYVKGYMK